jgi:hypothetical protein
MCVLGILISTVCECILSARPYIYIYIERERERQHPCYVYICMAFMLKGHDICLPCDVTLLREDGRV